MDLLTKYLLSGKVVKVKVLGSYSRVVESNLAEKANYLNNQGSDPGSIETEVKTIIKKIIMIKLVIEIKINESRRIRVTEVDCMCH